MRAVFVRLAVSGAVLPGCSSQSFPPNLTCDSGCVAPIGIVSVGPTTDAAAAGSCAPSATDSACVQCAKTSCCTDFALCSGNPECTSLSACEANCVDSTCVAMCQQLNACLGTACRACTDLGVGDPCAATLSACETGLTCNGQWCTKPCSSSTGCVGLGSAGANVLGEQSACVGTATSGNQCFPGCALSATDCAPFAGTACFSSMSVDGVTVAVCQNVRDAGVVD